MEIFSTLQTSARRCQFRFYCLRNSLINFPFHALSVLSDPASGAFPYCTEPGLNFSTTNYSEDDADFAGNRRGKASRVSCILNDDSRTISLKFFFFLQQDPLSHRIIEKRRRDRMNGEQSERSPQSASLSRLSLSFFTPFQPASPTCHASFPRSTCERAAAASRRPKSSRWRSDT